MNRESVSMIVSLPLYLTDYYTYDRNAVQRFRPLKP